MRQLPTSPQGTFPPMEQGVIQPVTDTYHVAPAAASTSKAASMLVAVHKTVEVLLGRVVPLARLTHCTAASACPLDTLLPELCPYGDAGCPGVHLQEPVRQEVINKAFGDRNPSVINMWERATRTGELAKHKFNRPGTYVHLT